MKYGRLAGMVFCLGWLISGNSQAAAIGMPESSLARVGLALGVANLTLDDPAGDVDSEWVVRPINLVYTDRFFSGYRYWAEVFYQDAVLSASTSRIGQNVKQLGARFSIQKPVVLTVLPQSWLGAGLQLSSERYENRHTVDADGYLALDYPDRDEVQTALLLNFMVEKEIAGLDVEAKVEQSIPFADGAREFTVALILLFGF